jgi:hypothetical protein
LSAWYTDASASHCSTAYTPLSITKMTGLSLKRVCVERHCAVIWKPPSPVKTITRWSGRFARLIPVAAAAL